MTNEFSLCLIPDTVTTESILAARKELPPSPYRDDVPHITLLKMIKTATPLSDDELLRAMDTLLELSKNMPLHASVYKPANRSNMLYSLSSLLLLQASPAMKAYRKNIIKILRRNGYTVGFAETRLFMPHITVRLGVPYSRPVKALIKQRFAQETTIRFNRWVIFRIVYKDGKRLVKELSL